MRFAQQFRVALSPSDYDQSVAFYRDTLGLKLFDGWDRPSGRGSIFQMGTGLIEIVTGEGSREAPGFFGVVVQLADADAAYQEIIGRGGDATEPRIARWGHRLFTVKAPDGVELIFIEEVGEGHPTD